MHGCYVGVTGKLRDKTEVGAQRWHAGIRSLMVVCCLLLVHAAGAEVVLPKVLGSHMVVQRSMPVHIWGWGDVGESVSVSFRNETKTTAADGAGFWEVYLPPGSAGGPFSLVVKGSNVVTLDDILVGDLWIASGQSNMQMPMGGFPPSAAVNNAEKEIAAARYPQIRTMQIAQTSSLYPLDDATVKSPWTECTPETIRSFSAVGYFFARDVHAAEKVPIGIIDSTWGGTPAEAWTSLPALTSHADMLPFLGAYADMMQDRAKVLRQIEIEKALAERAKANGEPAPKHIARRNVLIVATGWTLQRDDCSVDATRNQGCDLVPGRGEPLSPIGRDCMESSFRCSSRIGDRRGAKETFHSSMCRFLRGPRRLPRWSRLPWCGRRNGAHWHSAILPWSSRPTSAIRITFMRETSRTSAPDLLWRRGRWHTTKPWSTLDRHLGK